MISLEWQQDIQQNMVDILQKLQEIDDLVQPPQAQSAVKGGTKVIEVTDVYQGAVYSSLPSEEFHKVASKHQQACSLENRESKWMIHFDC